MSEPEHVTANNRERERMRALVERLSDADLARPVTDEWSVADMLGHMAFWDARANALANKLEAGVPFTASDHEPEDVDVMNAAAARLAQAIAPRTVAQLALAVADETDASVAALPANKMWPLDQSSPLNCFRANHRGEHLDQIEAALG